MSSLYQISFNLQRSRTLYICISNTHFLQLFKYCPHISKDASLFSLQAREERNYHVFYELLAGMNDWDKQELYLQGAETYYYLNQVRDPLRDAECFSSQRSFSRPQWSPPSFSRAVPVNWRASRISRTSSFCSDALRRLVCRLIRLQPSGPSSPPSYSWEICASVPMRWVGRLQERIHIHRPHCYLFIYWFISKSESFEVARVFSETEARRVGCLLQISSEALQTVITHRVTVRHYFFFYTCHWLSAIVQLSEQIIDSFCPQETTYDRIYCPLSVEGAIESRYRKE